MERELQGPQFTVDKTTLNNYSDEELKDEAILDEIKENKTNLATMALNAISYELKQPLLQDPQREGEKNDFVFSRKFDKIPESTQVIQILPSKHLNIHHQIPNIVSKGHKEMGLEETFCNLLD